MLGRSFANLIVFLLAVLLVTTVVQTVQLSQLRRQVVRQGEIAVTVRGERDELLSDLGLGPEYFIDKSAV